MEFGVSSRRMLRAIEQCEVVAFAVNFMPYIDAAVYFGRQEREFWADFNPTSPPRGDIPAADPLSGMSEQIAMDALLAFGIQSVYAEHSGALSALREELAGQLGADYVGHTLFDEPVDIPGSDLTRLVKYMINTLDAGAAIYPRDFWLIGLRFFEHHNRSRFGELLFSKLACWFRRGWQRILRDQAFVLFQPMRTVPPILAVLDGTGGGKAAIAALLLATAEAVRAPLSDDYVSELRAISDER
jgi:hypothetical protein